MIILLGKLKYTETLILPINDSFSNTKFQAKVLIIDLDFNFYLQ